MIYLLDTSVAIHLRDDTARVGQRVAMLTSRPVLSAVSRVELEGGVFTVPGLSTQRRAKLTIMLATLDVLDFTAEMAEIYGHIIQQIGYSRRKIIDRMIAATARAGDLTLITANGADFAEIPELKLEVWPVD